MRRLSAAVLAPVLLSGLLAVAGCGQETPAGAGQDPGTSGAAEPPPSQQATATSVELFAAATVLDDGSGPQLCVGAVAASLPPQCGGPLITNWDWSVGGSQAVRGTRWVEYAVVGRFQDDRQSQFRLTRPATPDEEYDGWRPSPPEEPELTTTCPEPEGGWAVLDAGRTTSRSMDATTRAARRLPGFAELWVDQSINPASDSEDDAELERLMNDPRKLILNVRVTGDPAEAEATLRRTWGGALCVTRARHTERELRAVQRELTDVPGMLSSGTGEDRVELSVLYDDGALQRRLDDEYGAGVVEVSSALVPYEGGR